MIIVIGASPHTRFAVLPEHCQQFHFKPELLYKQENVLGSNPDSQVATDANDIWTGVHVWFPEGL